MSLEWMYVLGTWLRLNHYQERVVGVQNGVEQAVRTVVVLSVGAAVVVMAKDALLLLQILGSALDGKY